MEGRDSAETPGPGQGLGLLRPQSTSWKAKVALPSPFPACTQSSRPAPHHRHCRSEGYTLKPQVHGYVQFPPDPLKSLSAQASTSPSAPPFRLFSAKPRKSFPIRKRFLPLSHRIAKTSSQLLFSHCLPADFRLFSEGNRKKCEYNRNFAGTIDEEEEDWTGEENC